MNDETIYDQLVMHIGPIGHKNLAGYYCHVPAQLLADAALRIKDLEALLLIEEKDL